MINLNATLVTGANGEIGQSLIRWLYRKFPQTPILALDIKPPVESIRGLVAHAIEGDITNRASYEQIARDYKVDVIFHLAALLSTRAEYDPALAHQVNVGGTFNILNLAIALGNAHGKSVKVIFPSSIAVYGVTDKRADERIREDQYLHPITMYGLNKLYCEELGMYYAQHYGQMSDKPPTRIDFRCVRFPGIISADTVPGGGTSDYGPEMIHAAAQSKPYEAFVRADATIPFMVMPDAVDALVTLANAPQDKLSRHIYNVTSFSVSAGQIADLVRSYFPDCQLTFVPHAARQRIVDSWPGALDDTHARHDWGWNPRYDAQTAFTEYLIPAICKRYGITLAK